MTVSHDVYVVLVTKQAIHLSATGVRPTLDDLLRHLLRMKPRAVGKPGKEKK